MPKQKEKYICLTKKIKIMNLENELLESQLLENQLLEKFQVEELEKRFEMGWIDDVVFGAEGAKTGTSLKTLEVAPFVNTGG